MNDKQQLAAMAQYRLTEEQAKAMAERMPQTGTLQILDDEPPCTEIRINGVEACGADIGGLLDRCLPHTTEQQTLCMAKRIEELEAQVRVMADLLREAQECVVHDVVRGMGRDVESLWARIDATLAGNLPAQHQDDAAVDRFAIAMKAKMAAAREKGRGGWDDPNACSVEFLADLLVGHVGKGNQGNFEDIANLAMMLHQRGADPAVLAGKLPVVSEDWQLVPVKPTDKMLEKGNNEFAYDCGSGTLYEAWYAMLNAAPNPEAK